MLKGIIVNFLYNYLASKLIYSLRNNKSLEMIENNFKQKSFENITILIVIFSNKLFCC